MIKTPERMSKLSPKFSGPYRVLTKEYGNTFKVWNPVTKTSDTVNVDRLKKVNKLMLPSVDEASPPPNEDASITSSDVNDYRKKLRSASKRC